MRLLLGVVLVLLPAARLSAQPSVSAWDLLRHELVSPNPEHRKQAIMAIGSIGPAPEVITILNESLRDKDITIRQATAALMGELKYPGNVPNLQAALDDDSEVASQAAKSLWNMGDRSGRRVLEALYTGQERGGPNMIESAMRDAKDKLHHPKKLATMGVNEASGALLGPFSMGIIVAEEAMKDSGAPGRALAVNLLAQDCDARAAQLMEWALDNDKSTLVRAATAKALGKCGNISTIPKLMMRIADGNAAVRDMAAASVVRLTIEKMPKKEAASGQ